MMDLSPEDAEQLKKHKTVQKWDRKKKVLNCYFIGKFVFTFFLISFVLEIRFC